MVGDSKDNDCRDSGSTAGRLDRLDKMGKMDIENADVVFCDVSHNRRNQNQIAPLFFPPLLSI